VRWVNSRGVAGIGSQYGIYRDPAAERRNLAFAVPDRIIRFVMAADRNLAK